MTCLANAAQLNFWRLFFNGTRWPGIAQNDQAAFALQQFYISLHNENPMESGSQNTFETEYPNYVRVAVPRVPLQWGVSGPNPTVAMNMQPITFAQTGGAIDTLSYWGLGSSPTGPGTMFLSAPVGLGAPTAFTVDANGNLTAPGAVLSLNTQVVLYSWLPSMVLPLGFAENVQYYVGTIPSTGVVTLSTTLNNANPVASVAPGAGVLVPTTPLTLVINQTVPSFPANALLAYLN